MEVEIPEVICFTFWITNRLWTNHFMVQFLNIKKVWVPCLPSSTVRVTSSVSLLTFSVRSWCCLCLDTCSSVSSSASFRKLRATQKQLCSSLLPIFYNLHTLTSILMQSRTYIILCWKTALLWCWLGQAEMKWTSWSSEEVQSQNRGRREKSVQQQWVWL